MQGRRLTDAQKISQIENGLLAGVRTGLQFLLDAQPGDTDTWASFTLFKKMVTRADTTYRNRGFYSVPGQSPPPQPQSPQTFSGVPRSAPNPSNAPRAAPSNPPSPPTPADQSQRGQKRSPGPDTQDRGPRPMMSRNQLRQEGRCFICYEHGHTMRDCSSRAPKRVSRDQAGILPSPPQGAGPSGTKSSF